ncbi:protein NAP1 isoform X2 [Prunus yedoensis var. nudiflora]|uniref:Protein NAP1 isoform X2 n=1 Tax=Prunus yedoensis var. nudiflora TaxID=2094558 RepID=A0A314XJY9_PRUYE|nr:protein NAP1 isoform X2 [Prunus yedoensis var. nudiflora]
MPVGGYFADSVTDLKELKAFVRIFGGYGVDRLDRMLKEHTAALLNCIDTSLRSNREVLEAVSGSLHSGDRTEREASIKQIIDIDTVIGFCVQAGLALAFDRLLAEASGAVLLEVYDHDSQWVRLILEEVGGANDGSWSFLPYLFATFMTSNCLYPILVNGPKLVTSPKGDMARPQAQ